MDGQAKVASNTLDGKNSYQNCQVWLICVYWVPIVHSLGINCCIYQVVILIVLFLRYLKQCYTAKLTSERYRSIRILLFVTPVVRQTCLYVFENS